MQTDFDSRVATVGFSHYMLVVDRPVDPKADQVGWAIQDRKELSDDEIEEPWYYGPEISFAACAALMNEKRGPHPPGLYVTQNGLQSK